MAVESRFVVIRHGVEVETFMDKKSADEYDKMLDMADSMAEFLESAPCQLDEDLREELSIFLAKNRDDVLIALQAKKAKPAPKKVAAKAVVAEEAETQARSQESDLVEQPLPDEQEALVEKKAAAAKTTRKAPAKKTAAKASTKAKTDAA